jgi:hypothetical protein
LEDIVENAQAVLRYGAGMDEQVAQALVPAASPLMGTLLIRQRVIPGVETSLDTAGTSACATQTDLPALSAACEDALRRLRERQGS